MESERIPEISVISPVYGVADFIGRAVRSMMEQTIDNVEFIFVDDCTPDYSIDILREVIEEYPHRQVRILRHDKNRGLPAARNTGLKATRGRYIFHWDSDDFADPDLLERLYIKAETEKCDYVWCDWYLTFGSNSRMMLQPSVFSPREALSIALAGGMKYNVWNKLVARRLYDGNNIKFPEGYSMGEDMTMIKLLAKSQKVGHVAKPLYHYIRTNSGAMTQVYSSRHLNELRHNTTDLCEYLSREIADKSIIQELEWFKLNVKLPFLFTGRKSDMKLWRSWYKESDKYIMSNRRQALRTRLLQWTAAHHLGIVNTLYNVLIFKFIYGVIYK